MLSYYYGCIPKTSHIRFCGIITARGDGPLPMACLESRITTLHLRYLPPDPSIKHTRERERKRSTRGDRVFFSSVELWEGFLIKHTSCNPLPGCYMPALCRLVDNVHLPPALPPPSFHFNHNPAPPSCKSLRLVSLHCYPPSADIVHKVPFSPVQDAL